MSYMERDFRASICGDPWNVDAECSDSLMKNFCKYFPKPMYVGFLKHLLFAIAIVVVLVAMFVAPEILEEKERGKVRKGVARHRWLAYSVGTAVVSMWMIQSIAKKTHGVDMICSNKQHFANLQVMEHYMNAFRTSMF